MQYRIATIMLLCALATGCMRVKPYQRETLSSRAMSPEADKAEGKLDGHVEEYREGSIGGTGVSGGGCGCN